MSERSKGDAGMTLLEMLIALTLTGIILTVLVASFLVYFTNATYTTGRDDHSAAAEILATYLDRDLASATSVPTTSVGTTCATSHLLLRLTWAQYNAAALPNDPPVAGTGSDVYQADYSFVTDSLDPNSCMIQRTYKSGSTVIAQNAIVHSLKAASFSSAASGTCGTGATAVTASLAQYLNDAPSNYSYVGCLKARTNGL